VHVLSENVNGDVLPEHSIPLHMSDGGHQGIACCCSRFCGRQRLRKARSHTSSTLDSQLLTCQMQVADECLGQAKRTSERLLLAQGQDEQCKDFNSVKLPWVWMPLSGMKHGHLLVKRCAHI
jgi:hypothetical protein